MTVFILKFGVGLLLLSGEKRVLPLASLSPAHTTEAHSTVAPHSRTRPLMHGARETGPGEVQVSSGEEAY